jgi:Ca-activated chloride channel family protein
VSARRVSLAALLAVVFLAQAAFGGSARDAVREGNKLYEQGQFNEAMKGYDEALQDRPEAVVPLFNKADSYYRLEDPNAALGLYKEVATKSRDMGLVAKAKYNAGNCSFELGCKQKDFNLQKAVEYMETAISYWRSVLELEPGNQKAARNIEVARLTIKDIIDQINKQKEQQEKQGQAAEKLKELLERQKSLAAKTGATNEGAASGDITAEEAKGAYGEQAKEQGGIRDETRQTAEDLTAQDPNIAQGSQMQDVVADLDMALASQEKAEEQLYTAEGEPAKESEDKAVEYIENALKALSRGEQNQQGQDQQQQQQEGQQQQQMGQQDPNQPQDPNEGQQNDQEQQGEQMQEEQQQAPDATAQEILDKEKQEREQRQTRQRGGYVPVDKDW